ncbi:MAG TPA: acyl-CoA carboxylase subunit epsilon [Streptomyces sp.]|nr:acyl-CoA carboxylase subunit epsilon [Streptomyces sp.]
MTQSSPTSPSIRVVRGNPTPEELAAALTVVQARAAVAGGTTEPARRGPAAWSDPARTVPQRVPHAGPGAWRATFWPG